MVEWWVILGGLAALAPALLLIEVFGRPWLVWWHGEGEAHQYQFYRCHGCRAIVTHRHIRAGGCRCHESVKISPAKLRTGEKVRLLLLPWTV